jgi:adiponectin receptor
MSNLRKRSRIPLSPSQKALKLSPISSVQRKETYCLGTHQEAPEWQQHEYILTGYRIKFSYSQCTQSLFKVHNESLNIWTHLIAALITLVEIFRVLEEFPRPNITHVSMEMFSWLSSPEIIPMSQVPIVIFLIGAFSVFFNSFVFHLLHEHSSEANDFLTCCDHGGICHYMISFAFAAIYYG